MELQRQETRGRPHELERMVDNAKRASDFLKALAHESRLIILCILAEGEKSVSELEHELEPAPADGVAAAGAAARGRPGVDAARRQDHLLQSRQRRGAHHHRRDLRRVLQEAAPALAHNPEAARLTAAVAGFTRQGIAEHGCLNEHSNLRIAWGHEGVGGLILNQRLPSRRPEHDKRDQRRGAYKSQPRSDARAASRILPPGPACPRW